MLNDLLRAACDHGLPVPSDVERLTYEETPAFFLLARTYAPEDVDHNAMLLAQIPIGELFSVTPNDLRDFGVRNWERLVPTFLN